MVGEHEKWSGEGSTWPVSTSFGSGTVQTARGWVNLAGGTVNMGVSEIACSGFHHLTAVNAVPSSSKRRRNLRRLLQAFCHLDEPRNFEGRRDL
jgi:hypothetical protein